MSLKEIEPHFLSFLQDKFKISLDEVVGCVKETSSKLKSTQKKTIEILKSDFKYKKKLGKPTQQQVLDEIFSVIHDPKPDWNELFAGQHQNPEKIPQSLDIKPIKIKGETMEQKANIRIYNRLLRLALKYNTPQYLKTATAKQRHVGFIVLLSKVKTIIENQEKYKFMFITAWNWEAKDGDPNNREGLAVKWITNILLNAGFACHPFQQDFKAQDYVNVSFNSIYPAFAQIEDVLKEEGDEVIVPLANKIFVANTGICLENAVEAFKDAADSFKTVVTLFKPDKPKMGNMGDFANDYKNSICLECSKEYIYDDVRSMCFDGKFNRPGLEKHLVKKLKGKKAKDGVIEIKDVINFVNLMMEYLYDCAQFKYTP